MQQAIGKYRWTICALLFFATTVNYLDRQVLSLLQPYLSDPAKFNWSNTDYANITAVFQFVYAFSMLFAGRIIDKLGTKKRICMGNRHLVIGRYRACISYSYWGRYGRSPGLGRYRGVFCFRYGIHVFAGIAGIW